MKPFIAYGEYMFFCAFCIKICIYGWQSISAWLELLPFSYHEYGLEGAMKREKTEYMCSYCGKKVMMAAGAGRPQPGKCPRKQGDRPHTWRINRKIPR